MQVFVVATPIGNLGDITLRALQTLREVDLILCEDTRVTRKLLAHHQIAGIEVVRFRENPYWMERFYEKNAGRKIALMTDSGTPAISDPGASLVNFLVQKNVVVSPIPGPSAALAAISVSGMARKGFIFLGFLGRSPKKITDELAQAFNSRLAAVFYESPYRVLKTFEIIAREFPDAQVLAAREISKIHEEFLRGSPAQILETLKNKKEIRGEFCVVIENKNS